jgi:hypothetical protein
MDAGGDRTGDRPPETITAPAFTDHGRTLDLAAGVWQFDVQTDPGLAERPQLRTCVLVLAAAGLACAAVGALVCARREFHVKTPEGS